MRQRSVSALFAAALAATPAHGQPAPASPAVPVAPAPAPAAPAPAGCSAGTASALTEIACLLGRDLPGLPSGATVVSGPLTSDAALEHPELLTARLAAVVAGAIGARASDEAAKLGRARTLAASGGTLVYLAPEIAHGELRVVTDAYPVPHGFWRRLRAREPSPVRHAFASRRLDAEIRSLMPAVPLVAAHIERAKLAESDSLAIACGDVDGDGALEIALVGRRRVALGRIRGGELVTLATVAWKDLSPVAPSPLREPIASAVIAGGHLDVGITDRAYGVRLGAGLEKQAQLAARLPWPGGGCTRMNHLVVRGEIEPCMAGEPAPELAAMRWGSDAISGASIVGKDGKRQLLRALRIANEPVVVLADDTARSVRLEGAGAQLAVGDLDGDGQPELLSTSSTLDPKGDALVVHTWQADGQLLERLRVAVPSGVRALAVCPPEDSGLSAVAMATGDGVWVVR